MTVLETEILEEEAALEPEPEVEEELEAAPELVSLPVANYPGFELLVSADWFDLNQSLHILYLVPTNRHTPGRRGGYYFVNYIPEILAENDLAAACLSAAYDIGYINGDLAPEDATHVAYVGFERIETTCELCSALFTSRWDHVIEAHRDLLEAETPPVKFTTNIYFQPAGA